jgi:hypothetical protein
VFEIRVGGLHRGSSNSERTLTKAFVI